MRFSLYVLSRFFFFKQKTAYEVRISDWSSDVCSSDLMDAFESDVPERAVRRTLALGSPTGWSAWKRPVRLLRRPERLSNVVALLPDHPPRRFVWRGQIYRVVAGDGTERIHGQQSGV